MATSLEQKPSLDEKPATRHQRSIDRVTEAITNPLQNRPRLSTALLFTPSVLWMLLFVTVPLVVIFVISFWTTKAWTLIRTFSLQNYQSMIADPTYRHIIPWTLFVVLLMVVICGLLGYSVALFLSRAISSARLRLILLLMLVIPFWTNYLIRMTTWLPLLGRNGLVNYVLVGTGILKEPTDALLYNAPSMLWVMVLLYSLFVIGPSAFMIQKIDNDLVWAAYILGANPWQVFHRIILPLSYPGLAAGCLFVAVMVIGEYATELTIGGGKTPLLAGDIYRYIQYLQWPQASTVAIVLVFLSLLLVYAFARIVDITREV
jgi:putative spermidine/putrescine transport system permease protein